MVRKADALVLLDRYHRAGDLEARQTLIVQSIPLVRSLARRYAGGGEQVEDLVQVGTIGLIKAVDRFDLSRGVEFPTYAIPLIIGEIKRHFRDSGWGMHVPRGLQELNVRLWKLNEQLTVELGRSPTVAELAKAAGVGEEAALEALECGRAYAPGSLSQAASANGDESDPLEALGESDSAYEAVVDRVFLARGFRVLDQRERTVVRLRFFEGLTQLQIARRLGISQMHVSRLIRHALDEMHDALAGAEELAA